MKLHVEGDVNEQQNAITLIVKNTGTGWASYLLENEKGNTWSIGVPGSISPDIEGILGIFNLSVAGDSTRFLIATSGNTLLSPVDGSVTIGGFYEPVGRLHINGLGDLDNASTDDDVVVSNNGNVGIDTTSPQTKLDVSQVG